MTERIRLERFERLLDAYGAEPLHWPAAERAEAVALLAGSLPARRAWKQAQFLDRALEQFAVPQIDAAQADQLAARLSRAPQLPARRGVLAALSDVLGIELRPALLWPHAAGLVAAAVAGFYLGVTAPTPTNDAFDVAPVVEAVL
ncbi:hypothetical protein [Roseiterribacter gracilis]|uniref:Uncharacterized protein n=1 Tax=Roseiterribacter gracilis TaxID=2812848 RepID=A0A8S8XHZ0_9PROT|nr:hypothetical protein TMPK1_37760 [Rhodospirillales bacterium TMPK1]